MDFQAPALTPDNPGGQLLAVSEKASPMEWAAKALQIQATREKIQMDREKHDNDMKQHQIDISKKIAGQMQDALKLPTKPLRKLTMDNLEQGMTAIGRPLDPSAKQAIIDTDLTGPMNKALGNFMTMVDLPGGEEAAKAFTDNMGGPKAAHELFDLSKKAMDMKEKSDTDKEVTQRAKDLQAFNQQKNDAKNTTDLKKAQIMANSRTDSAAMGADARYDSAVIAAESRKKNAQIAQDAATEKRADKFKKETKAGIDKATTNYRRIFDLFDSIKTAESSGISDYEMVNNMVQIQGTPRVNNDQRTAMTGATSFLDKISQKYGKFTEGTSLTPELRQDLYDTAQRITVAYAKSYRDALTPFMKTSEKNAPGLNLDLNEIFTPRQLKLLGKDNSSTGGSLPATNGSAGAAPSIPAPAGTPPATKPGIIPRSPGGLLPWSNPGLLKAIQLLKLDQGGHVSQTDMDNLRAAMSAKR